MKFTNARGRHIVGSRAASLLLPGVPLALKQVPALARRDELLRLAVVIRVVRLPTSGQGDDGAVMKVVVPERIEAVAPLVDRADHPHVLRLVLGDDDHVAPGRGGASFLPNHSNDVGFGAVVDALGCVEAQTVEVELSDPVCRIAREVLPDGDRVQVHRN